MTGESKAVEKWADVAMWSAPKHEDPQHPKVTVSTCTRDPLGVMGMVNGQYTGKVYNRPSEVPDDEKRAAWEMATVSLLSEAPLEWIQLSLSFENVSRAFTHQLVRHRMAGYAQESMRFAVKSDVGNATKLPPSLNGTMSTEEHMQHCLEEGVNPAFNRSKEQAWRNMWDSALRELDDTYAALVDSGMPAEDARGLLPTNVLTRIHMHTDMGTLLKLAGKRLCTQAQFEWREVMAQVVEAIRAYRYQDDMKNAWQYELMAERFRPVCFAAGHCPVNSAADRHCSIRAQVNEMAEARVPSSEWEPAAWGGSTHHPRVGIPLIRPEQWLADPKAARVKP